MIKWFSKLLARVEAVLALRPIPYEVRLSLGNRVYTHEADSIEEAHAIVGMYTKVKGTATIWRGGEFISLVEVDNGRCSQMGSRYAEAVQAGILKGAGSE